MIIICDRDLNRTGVVRNAISAAIVDELNGEYTLEFEAVLDAHLNSLIAHDTVFEVDGQYFDIATHTKESTEDNLTIISVLAEHVSYRLNNPEWDFESFYYTGVPIRFLEFFFDQTPFVIGDCLYYDEIRMNVESACSRRKLLMDLQETLSQGSIDDEEEVELCHLIFDNFTVHVRPQLTDVAVSLDLSDRYIRTISTSTDHRKFDKNGDPVVSITCTLTYAPDYKFKVGDWVSLVDSNLGISQKLSLVSKSYNPYDDSGMVLKFESISRGIEDPLRRLQEENTSGLPPPTFIPAPGEYVGGVNVRLQSQYLMYIRQNYDIPITFESYFGAEMFIGVNTALATYAFDPKSKKFSQMVLGEYIIAPYRFVDQVSVGSLLDEGVVITNQPDRYVIRVSDNVDTGTVLREYSNLLEAEEVSIE